MMPRLEKIHQMVWAGTFYVYFSAHRGLNLVVFVCSSNPVVLFDNPGTSKCLNTLFLLSPHLCIIKGFICDLLVARNDSWMS